MSVRQQSRAWSWAIRLAATLAIGVFAPAYAQTDAGKSTPPSVETYMKNPDFLGFLLSPNGKFLATSVPVKGRQNLAIVDLEKRAMMVLTGETLFDVAEFNWVSNDRLVYSLGNLGEPNNGSFQRGGGLFAINRDGSGRRVLSDTVDNQVKAGVNIYRGLSFESRAPRADNSNEDSDTDIIASSAERSVKSIDLVRVNTVTGRKQLITTNNPGHVRDWLLDNDGVPRIALSSPTGLESVVYYRSTESSPWKELRRIKVDESRFEPLAFDFDNKTLFVATNEGGRDKTAIFKFDPETNTLGALIAEHPIVDVGLNGSGGGSSRALRFDRDKKTLVAVGITGPKPERIWFDPEYDKIQKSIDATLKDTYNTFLRTRVAGVRKTLVMARSDRQPLKYYLLDEEKHTLEEVISTRKGLGPDNLVEQRPVVIPTRDGKQLQGYLFLPKGAKIGDKLPMVVNVHGGPQVRADTWADDSWGFRESQLFASRGYAVLLPNFRMTPGFGAEIFLGGQKQMGKRMAEDKEDAVAWAVTQGIANPAKVCIYGASYGGYAALQGIVKTPDLYACSIAALAPSDLRRQLTSPVGDFSQSENGLQYLSWQWGDPDKDRALLEEMSPAFHADRIKKPLLMIYGQEDRRVPIEQGERMRAAMDKAGKPYEWMAVPEEGHGYGKIENRVAVYDRILSFLDRHIGPAH